MRSRSLAPSLAPAALLLSLALAACTTDTPDDASSPGTPGSSADAPSVTSDYYPVAIGNTWTYRTTYPEPLGVVTSVETMTAVTEDGDEVRATVERSVTYADGAYPDFSDTVEYVFHADGSLTVPYQVLPDSSGGQVVVTLGQLEWPTFEEFEAATPRTGSVEASVDAGGIEFDQTVTFTVVGDGVEEVTVPAGSFEARRMLLTLVVTIPMVGVADEPLTATVWLAPGTGMVRTEVPDIFGGAPIVSELVEFTAGG